MFIENKIEKEKPDMMEVRVFSTDKNKGNPAGIVLHADNISDNEMLEIAKRLGFSESAFLEKADEADFKIRYFSPKQEVDLCGHATIAAVHALIERKLIILKKSDIKVCLKTGKSGDIEVICQPDGKIVMVQKPPIFSEKEVDRSKIAELLSLQEEALLGYPIQAVSTGVPKLIIPIKTLDFLFSIKPKLKGMEEYCIQKNIKGFYPFSLETIENDSDAHARQFNPLAGINEDPITGIAAGALGAYLKNNNIADKKSFIVEQGYIMDKFGKMYVEVDGDIIKVGGYAVSV